MNDLIKSLLDIWLTIAFWELTKWVDRKLQLKYPWNRVSAPATWGEKQVYEWKCPMADCKFSFDVNNQKVYDLVMRNHIDGHYEESNAAD